MTACEKCKWRRVQGRGSLFPVGGCEYYRRNLPGGLGKEKNKGDCPNFKLREDKE